MAVIIEEFSARGEYWKERHRLRRGVLASPCWICWVGVSPFLSQYLLPLIPLLKRLPLDLLQ